MSPKQPVDYDDGEPEDRTRFERLMALPFAVETFAALLIILVVLAIVAVILIRWAI